MRLLQLIASIKWVSIFLAGFVESKYQTAIPSPFIIVTMMHTQCPILLAYPFKHIGYINND